MAAPRKPRPEALDRATVEAMIAEAVAVERERHEADLTGLVLALGRIGEDLNIKTAAILDIRRVVHKHADTLVPLAAAVAGIFDLSSADAASRESTEH